MVVDDSRFDCPILCLAAHPCDAVLILFEYSQSAMASPLNAQRKTRTGCFLLEMSGLTQRVAASHTRMNASMTSRKSHIQFRAISLTGV